MKLTRHQVGSGAFRSASKSIRWLLPVSVLVLVACQDTPSQFLSTNAVSAASASRADGFDPWRQRVERAKHTGLADYVASEPGPGRFQLVAHGSAAPLVVSSADFPGVLRAANDLQADINRVTRVLPSFFTDELPAKKEAVLIGTIGKSPLIDDLIANGKLDVTGIAGKWETSLVQVIEKPMTGLKRALVIAGSDQRGTIFGIYDLSKQIGVSPWYWWDDIPPRPRTGLYVLPGRHSQGEPAVKYRGFFINDENPATGTWAPQYFGEGLAPGYPGGLNHFYWEKIFEVALRLRANYIWPAVWGRAFAEDDPENHATAKRYGIVMGTSHEAPMMRGIEEWNRHVIRDASGAAIGDPYGGNGLWRYSVNAPALQAYWRDGIQRMVDQDFEGLVTIGMRGPGDVSLPPEDGIPLVNSFIAAQRQIIADVTGKDPSTVPQVWTLYKEVQTWWDVGLRVPDDVTVIWCDDNWGNLRKIQAPDEPARSGGYGLYYHFDYVGDGRNYKWVDTILLPNTWEQLNLTYTNGIDRVWMVNVGDMKNEELPLQFFLDYAWDPESLPAEAIPAWERAFATQQFGHRYAAEIAEILHDYSLLQSDRKPELLNRKISLDPTKDVTTDPTAVLYNDQGNPFSLTNYREMERVVGEWKALAARAERIGQKLPADLQDAYYELVLYQVAASANLYELRLAEFTNIAYASQGRSATADLAAEAETRFAEDLAMAAYYNTTLAGGKWNGWQTQPHIDYGDVARYGPNAPWQQPELNNVAIPDVIFPALQQIELPAGAEMGVAIDGSDRFWPLETTPAILPAFSPFQRQPPPYIEVFNRGTDPFDYTITPAVPWVLVWPSAGTVEKQVRAQVFVNWFQAPKGTTEVPITVAGPSGSTVEVLVVIENPDVNPWSLDGFVEANGYISMEADHYSRAVSTGDTWWKRIADIGRTGAGMTPFPVNAPRQTPGGDSPRLEYKIHTFSSGPVVIWAYLSPRNNVFHTDGLQYAVSIDDGPIQTVNITLGTDSIFLNRPWARHTSDNVNLTATNHVLAQPGGHVIKFWMVDPTAIVQKLVLDTGGLKESYLGPPESLRLGPSAFAGR